MIFHDKRGRGGGVRKIMIFDYKGGRGGKEKMILQDEGRRGVQTSLNKDDIIYYQSLIEIPLLNSFLVGIGSLSLVIPRPV